MELNCPKCSVEINEEMNYCSNCGEPLTSLAVQREELKHTNAGLEMLAKLTTMTRNPDLIKLIKDFADKQ